MISKRAALIVLPFALMLAACGEQGANGAAGDNAATPAADTAAAPAAPAVDLAAVEAEVRNAVEEYNRVYGSNDVDAYFAWFDPGLTQWYPSGRMALAPYETSWRQNVASGGGNTKVAVTDLQIQVDPTGDAAVATYVLEVTPRENGQPVDKVERNQETDVLFKRDGAWKIVHVNYGPAAPAKP